MQQCQARQQRHDARDRHDHRRREIAAFHQPADQADRHRRDERGHHGTRTRALSQKKCDRACGTADAAAIAADRSGMAGQDVGRRARRAECDTGRQLCECGRRIRADSDERRTEAVGEMQYQRHTRDRRARRRRQLEKNRPAAVVWGTGDDVADRTDQRKAGQERVKDRLQWPPSVRNRLWLERVEQRALARSRSHRRPRIGRRTGVRAC